MADHTAAAAPQCYPSSIADWLEFGAGHFRPLEGAEDIGRFGPANSGALAIEATALYSFVHALAANDTAFDLSACSLAPEVCGEHGLAAFRYCLHTHRSHPRNLPEELAWGGTGMSPKMSDQLALAAEVLAHLLSEGDREAFARLIEYEADCNILLPYHLEHVDHGYYRKRPPVPTQRFGTSYPESNAWRANILARALVAAPDHAHAAEWEESLVMHLANALSVPADAEDDTRIGGTTLSELHVGANLHPNFAMEHHGFFHPGYVNRALLSLFSVAYAYDDAGVERPSLLLRHVPEVWDVQRRLLLWDGRLAYPAGNDYPRYLWGLLYLLPVLTFMQHEYDDAVAGRAENKLADLLIREQCTCDEGSFCASRLEQWREEIEENEQTPPRRPAPSVYYRSQVDTPYYMALSWWWHRRNGPAEPASDADIDTALDEPFAEPDCGLVFQRSRERFASWSWNAYGCGAQGLVLPRDGDHMAEWRGNLISRFQVRGAPCDRQVLHHRERTFDGGFATIGTMATCDGHLTHTVAFAALPDGRTTLYCSNAVATAPTELLMHEGMCLNIANDIFNDNHRRLASQDCCRVVQGIGAAHEQIHADGPWLNLDEMLAVIAMDDRERFTVVVNGQRRADGYSLCYDEVLHPHQETRRTLYPGAVVEDAAVAFVTSLDSLGTARWPGRHLGPSCTRDNTRVVTVRGMNDRWYLLAASSNDEPIEVHLPLTMQAAGSRMLVGDPENFRLVGDGVVLMLPPREMLLVALAADAE